MGSPQTLSIDDRRLVAAWAADCVERVLPLFERDAPHDERPRAAVARARSFARGEVRTADEIRRRFAGGVPADGLTAPAAAVARAAGQAVAVCHMGAHALGAAAYTAHAAGLAASAYAEAVDGEVRWQHGHASGAVRVALAALPPVGANRSGPLAPGGLLDSGAIGAIVRAIQSALAERASGAVT